MPISAQRLTPGQAILWGGLICGVLDAIDGVVANALHAGLNPMRKIGPQSKFWPSSSTTLSRTIQLWGVRILVSRRLLKGLIGQRTDMQEFNLAMSLC
jgi:hypothetical protein